MKQEHCDCEYYGWEGTICSFFIGKGCMYYLNYLMYIFKPSRRIQLEMNLANKQFSVKTPVCSTRRKENYTSNCVVKSYKTSYPNF